MPNQNHPDIPPKPKKAPAGAVARKQTIEMAGIPKFSHADSGTEQFARECMHHLLELVDWEAAGKPKDREPAMPDSLRGDSSWTLTGRIRLMAGEIVRTHKDRVEKSRRQTRSTR